MASFNGRLSRASNTIIVFRAASSGQLVKKYHWRIFDSLAGQLLCLIIAAEEKQRGVKWKKIKSKKLSIYCGLYFDWMAMLPRTLANFGESQKRNDAKVYYSITKPSNKRQTLEASGQEIRKINEIDKRVIYVWISFYSVINAHLPRLPEPLTLHNFPILSHFFFWLFRSFRVRPLAKRTSMG